MKNLPNIYKNVVEVDNNRNTFYSKTESVMGSLEETPVVRSSQETISDTITKIFKQKAYSYTKRVQLTVGGNTYETRLVREGNGKVLTIDNELIDISSIEKIKIII